MMAWLRYLISLPFVATIRAACWVTGWSSYEVGQLALMVAAGCDFVGRRPFSWPDMLFILMNGFVTGAAWNELRRLEAAPPSDVLPDPGWALNALVLVRGYYLIVVVPTLLLATLWGRMTAAVLVVLTSYAYQMGQPGGPSCVRRALDAVGRLHLGSLRLRPALVGR